MNSRFIKSLAVFSLSSCALLLTGSLLAHPVVVKINDVPNGAPVITVVGAPSGYEIYTDDEIAVPGVEEGAVIILHGFSPAGLMDEPGWRFLDPRDPDSLPPYYVEGFGNVRSLQMAVDIVWTEHHPETGDLAIGFDSALPGTWYWSPGVPWVTDESAGTVTNNWVTLYADDEIVLMFKPHTYIVKK